MGSSAPLPRSLRWYTAGLLLVTLVSFGIAVAHGGVGHAVTDARFWAFAAFILAGELLPLRVPRRDGHDVVTVSTAFAMAALLEFGAAPAMLCLVAASAVADVVSRARPLYVVFNAAQYVVAVGAAGLVLALLGVDPPLHVTAGTLGDIAACAAAFFVTNHLLAGAGSAVLNRVPVPRHLVADLGFHVVTGGFVLALAPVVVACADASALLIPLCFLPMLAIYLGGRQAAVNGHRATHDVLTELPNRALLQDRLATALQRAGRRGQSVVVLMLDLNDFKAVNDTLGHGYGDMLLQQLAPRLQGCLGPGDLLARLGGDEFAVLLADGTDVEAGEAVAADLLHALDAPFAVSSLALDVRASIGIAAYPAHGTGAEELVQHADQALYRAKASGRGFEVYAAEHDEHSLDRLALAGQLRRGIERDELVVHYQPKVPLVAGGRPGAEALVRWRHPQLGFIGPEGFIGLAEQSGLIRPLTAWVLRDALRQRAAWARDGLEVTVSVNLSSRNLLEPDLVAEVAELLAQEKCPRGGLQLEVTETRIVADLRRAREVLEQLRGMGVTIAIDDFGIGFSSLAQLQQLRVDEIKIDKSFVLDMETNADDAAIVRSTVHLGHDLGLRVTAEGVESAAVLEQLEELGCDFAQGFHLGRPMAPEQCAKALRQAPVVPLAIVTGGRAS